MTHNQTLIIDLDGTITVEENLPYADKRPNLPLIKQLKHYKKQGFRIVIFTSRAMRTYNGNIAQIKAKALPEILAWLQKHKIPFDEVVVGKIWCGESGFYVDDRAIRPSEFATLSFSQITQLLEQERHKNLQSTQLTTPKATCANLDSKLLKSTAIKSAMDSADFIDKESK